MSQNLKSQSSEDLLSVAFSTSKVEEPTNDDDFYASFVSADASVYTKNLDIPEKSLGETFLDQPDFELSPRKRSQNEGLSFDDITKAIINGSDPKVIPTPVKKPKIVKVATPKRVFSPIAGLKQSTPIRPRVSRTLFDPTTKQNIIVDEHLKDLADLPLETCIEKSLQKDPVEEEIIIEVPRAKRQCTIRGFRKKFNSLTPIFVHAIVENWLQFRYF